MMKNTNLALVMIEQRVFQTLAEEIFTRLGAENDLTADEKLYWLDRGHKSIEIAEDRMNQLKQAVASFEKSQTAHLN